MRGRVRLHRPHQQAHRITPACAGKSGSSQLTAPLARDHPRMCGEEMTLPFRSRWPLWITPACAGKSLAGDEAARASGDHPRMCGEEQFVLLEKVTHTGSPPRMRGRVTFTVTLVGAVRITPAYAGKRRKELFLCAACKDHPRVRGEESSGSQSAAHPAGSPPRARGRGKVNFICRQI